MTSLYLALDQGGHASRAVVFDHWGNVVTSHTVPISTHHPAPGYVEHEAHEVLQSLRAALEQTAQALGKHTARLVAAGLATQRSSVLCWQRGSGSPLTPILSWQDTRGARYLESVCADSHALTQLHARTGLYPSAHQGASKLRWLLDHYPELHPQSDLAYGPLASFLAQQLTHAPQPCSEPSTGARSLLYNLQQRSWDAELAALWRLPLAPLPRCVPSHHNFGHISLGDHRVPLVLAMGDQAAAVHAHGVPAADTAYINIGTGAFILWPMLHSLTTPQKLLTSVLRQETEGTLHLALEATINGAGSAVDWLGELLPPREVVAHADHWLQTIHAPPLFLNGIAGLGSPYWRSDFSSRFIGEAAPEALCVGVLESIVFLLYANIEYAATHGVSARSLLVSGGWSRLDGLCQRLADMAQHPVTRHSDCEATARGLAVLLAAPHSCSWTSPRAATFLPTSNPALRARYQLWRSLMPEIEG